MVFQKKPYPCPDRRIDARESTLKICTLLYKHGSHKEFLHRVYLFTIPRLADF